MINLKQVHSLLAVVEAGSVNRAADVLCLAPSSVSAQLRELSKTLGITLFDPAGRGLVLSTAGRQLLPKFQQIVSVHDELTAAAQTLVSEPAGELRLYAPSSMCIYRIPPLIEALHTSAPGIELHLQHDPFDYRQALTDRTIEAAVVVIDKPEPLFQHLTIAREEVILVGHPELISHRTLTPLQLSGQALITTEPGCSYRTAAENHFREHGLRLSPRQSFSNVEVIRRCLLAKMGIGLLPRCVVAEDLRNGTLQQQQVDGVPYEFESAIIWPLHAIASPRLNQLLNTIRERQLADKPLPA